jgi:hypothetical protein
MESAAHLDLHTLRAAAVAGDGTVAPLPFLVAGTLTWPVQHAHRVAHAWRAWADATGGVVRSGVRIVRPPRRPAVVAVDVVLAAEASGAVGALTDLRALEPAIDSVRIVPPAAVMPAPTRVPSGAAPVAAGWRLRALPAEAVDAFAAAAAEAPLLSVELHRVGGGHGVAALGAARGADETERVRIAVAQLERALSPWR